MAQRRMFSLKITNSDPFTSMPLSTQCLYFHLSMNADDDGFIDGVKRIRNMINATEDDLRLLLSKGFVIPFESGVCVIKHWRIHNYIQKDRYTPTMYEEEKQLLSVDKRGAYTSVPLPIPEVPKLPDNTDDNTNVSKMDTQDRLGKDRLGKDRLELENNGAGAPTRTRFIPPTVEEVAEYCKLRGNNINPQYFVDYYETRNWKVSGKTTMKDWKAAIRTWEQNNFNNGKGGGHNAAGRRNPNEQPRRVFDGEEVL